MKPNENQTYRARLTAINKLKNKYPELARFIRNGVIPNECQNVFKALQKEAFKALSKNETASQKPLTFTELTSFNTWFTIYPGKVAGKEHLTTSRDFPVTIKGTKQDIVNAIERTISRKNDKIRIAKVKAEVKLKLLKLLDNK